MWFVLIILMTVVLMTLISWLINVYQKLLISEEAILNIKGQIIIETKRKWYNISSLVSIAGEFEKPIRDELFKVIDERLNLAEDVTLKHIEKDEELFNDILHNVQEIADIHPIFKESLSYKTLFNKVNHQLENMQSLKKEYNQTVERYNRIGSEMPNKLIAEIVGFKFEELFTIEKS